MPYLPSRPGLGGVGKGGEAALDPSLGQPLQAGPGALTPQMQGLSGNFCICYLNLALSFATPLKTLPLGSSPEVLIPSELAYPSTVKPRLLEREVGGQ